MPHITLKMLAGRTDEQKRNAARKLSEALTEAIGCTPSHISVSVEEYTPQQWQDIYKKDVAENDKLIITPDYDPKDMLK